MRCLWPAMLVAVMGMVGIGHAQEASDDDRLSDYLSRLGLVELQTFQLEQRVVRAARSDERSRLAKQLADLYAQQLMESLDDKERYDDLARRVESLLQLVPGAKTPSLEVLLLQADYQRAETLLGKWMTQAGQQASRDEAATILERITPVLVARQAELGKQAEARQAALDTASSVPPAAERELKRLQTIAARAAYFAGWSLYYRAVLQSVPDPDGLREARQLFRHLLGFADDEKYTDVDAELLGLESSWRARTLIGLGLTEAALGDVKASRDCFRILAGKGTPPDLRDQADYWYVQGLLNAGRRDAAAEFAAQVIPALTSEATQGKVNLCAALVRAAYSDGGRRQDDLSAQLAQLGIRGLARLRQYRVLRQMMADWGVEVRNPQGFLLTWLQGQQLREQAEKTGDAADYAAAASAFQQALAAPDAGADVAAAGHCRVEWAWCLYQMGKPMEAVRQYQQAAEALHAAGDRAAVDAGWMAFASAHRAWQDDPRLEREVRDAAAWLSREYPTHERTRRAEFLITKMRLRDATIEEKLQALEAVGPSDPSYVAARQDRCLVLYERWCAADAEQREAAARDLYQAVDQLLAMDPLDLPPTDQLALRLMAADVACRQEDWKTAEAQLDAAEPIVAGAGEEREAEYHYRRIQAARGVGDEGAARRHALWFVDHGGGTRFESAGLVAAAKSWASVITPDAQAVAALRSAYEVYRRLSRIWGDTPDALRTNRNALIAVSKMAQFAEQSGRLAEAAMALDKLLAAYPKDRNFLRRRALLAYEEGEWANSLERWRIILAGTEVGSEPWYEARYYQIRCLLRLDRSAAVEVLQQVQLLDPQLGPAPWREKFQSLRDELK